MYSKTKKMIITSLLAALACVATMIVKIPSPLNGYINLGDCIVLVTAFLLSPGYGFAAAGLGSALADLLSGYIVYAPATFLIKGIMALIVFFCFRLLHKKIGKLPARLIGGILAEFFMILGYFLFEGILYSFSSSLVNIPLNCIQGAVGLTLGLILVNFFEKAGIHTN